MILSDADFMGRRQRLFVEPKCRLNEAGIPGGGTGLRAPAGSAGFNSLADFFTAQDIQTKANAANIVAGDNALAIQTLAGADMANNIATGAITAGDVTGLPDATLGGDAPPSSSTGTPWTTYLIFAGLAFVGWRLWKKFRHKK